MRKPAIVFTTINEPGVSYSFLLSEKSALQISIKCETDSFVSLKQKPFSIPVVNKRPSTKLRRKRKDTNPAGCKIVDTK